MGYKRKIPACTALLQRKFATYIYTYVHTRFGDSLVVRSGYELAALVEEGHGVAGLQVVVVFLAHLARPRVPLINLIHTHTNTHNATQSQVSQSVGPSFVANICCGKYNGKYTHTHTLTHIFTSILVPPGRKR